MFLIFPENKKIITIIGAAQIVFLISYYLKFHNYILGIVLNNPAPNDVLYYSEVLNNLYLPVILGIVLTFSVVYFYSRIKDFLATVVSERVVFTFCFILLLAFQLLILFYVKTVPISDSLHYIRQAEILSETGEYKNSFGNYTAFWPVGYPALLMFMKWLTGDYILFTKILNIIISLLFASSVYSFFRLYLSGVQRKILIIISFLYPNLIFSVNVLLTDYIFVTLIWTSLYLSQRYTRSIIIIVVIGIILAFAALIRPVGLVIPFIFLLVFIKHKQFREGFILISVFVLMLTPWTFRNYKVYNTLVPVATNGGYNFLMGNHSGASGGVNFNFEYDLSDPDEPEESSMAYMKGVDDIVNNPFRIPVLLFKKVFYTYLRGDSSVTWSLKKTHNDIPGALLASVFYFTNLFFYIIVLFSLISLVVKRQWKLPGESTRWLLMYSICFLSVILIYVGGERYQIPLLPVHFYFFVKNF